MGKKKTFDSSHPLDKHTIFFFKVFFFIKMKCGKSLTRKQYSRFIIYKRFNDKALMVLFKYASSYSIYIKLNSIWLLEYVHYFHINLLFLFIFIFVLASNFLLFCSFSVNDIILFYCPQKHFETAYTFSCYNFHMKNLKKLFFLSFVLQ